MNKIYLDQASTSFPKAPSVAQAVYDYLAGSAVNVNRGGYRAAYSVEEQIFETREQLLKLFHFTSGKGKNVIFTENITASLNVLLKGLLKPGDHVLVTARQKKPDFLMVLMKRVILLIQILKIKILQTAVQPVCFWILPKN